MSDEYEVAEEVVAKPKRRDVPDALAEMDLPWEPERYAMDGCAITLRDGSEEYPFEGQSVWLSPYTPASLQEAGMEFMSGDNAKQADAFGRLRKGLAQVVVYHDIVDPNTGEPYRQWWHDAEAITDAPSNMVFYVWTLAISGEPADERPKGSTRGSGGTRTKRSTATRSRS